MSNILNLLRAICDFLQKVRDITFPLIVNKKCPRRSIVRFIGSNLPIPSPPKVYIYIPPWKTFDKKLSQTTIHSDISSSIDDSASREGSEVPCDCSDISCMHETKLTQLQNELKELREQVASILRKQSSCGIVETDQVVAAAPPPPPPLPPPCDFSTPFVTPKRKPLAIRNSTLDLNPLGDVLREIKSGPPKLKPIERSPGGRPVKKPKILTDPSDILTEVLRKRFIAAHMSSDTNDSDTSSQQDVFSPTDWNTCFA